jgi:hypothetical protein
MGIPFTQIYDFNCITVAVKARGHHEPDENHYLSAGPSETSIIV